MSAPIDLHFAIIFVRDGERVCAHALFPPDNSPVVMFELAHDLFVVPGVNKLAAEFAGQLLNKWVSQAANVVESRFSIVETFPGLPPDPPPTKN